MMKNINNKKNTLRIKQQQKSHNNFYLQAAPPFPPHNKK